MGQALSEAYGDIFLISANPTTADKDSITGKFKSFHNASDNVAKVMASTFYALLELAELPNEQNPKDNQAPPPKGSEFKENDSDVPKGIPGLHYNIQVHLPATKDIEVYNAIFKSIKEHLY